VGIETLAEDIPSLTEALVRTTELLAADALRERGRFSLALPGGSVAQAFLPRLARAAVDWARTDLFWGDERAVPAEHPDSNYGLARTLWLAQASLPAERVHPMPAQAADLSAAARGYESEMAQALGTPPALDLALVGVGPDGHVCSLFPGHPLLAAPGFVAAIFDSPKPPPARLTLTLPALAAARLLVVAAFGAAKAEVMREALGDPASSLPVALALRRSSRALVLLDPAAAGR